VTDDGRSESEQSGPNGPSEDESTKDGPSGPVKFIGFVVAVLGIVLVAVTPNPPISFQHWVQVIGGASITGFLTTFAGWYELVRPGGRLFHGAATTVLGWIVEHWRLLVVGVVLSTALALGVPPAWDFARGVAIDVRGCSPATQLRVVASPATVATARELAGAYERFTADENHGCPTADVYVYAAQTSEIREELGKQWSDGSGALRDLGPRPDVWLAGTSHETAGLGSAIASSTTVAFSPVVLAVPQGVTNLQPRQSAGWNELFGRLTDQGVPVVRADPDSSPTPGTSAASTTPASGPTRSSRGRCARATTAGPSGRCRSTPTSACSTTAPTSSPNPRPPGRTCRRWSRRPGRTRPIPPTTTSGSSPTTRASR
jgi:hypothetical protein